MNQLLFVFLTIMGARLSSTTLITPCGGSADPFDINIEGCEDGVNDRCVFVKGNSYGFTIGGISSTSALSLNTTLKAMVGFSFVTLHHVDLCEDLQVGECPIEHDEQFVYDRMIFNVTNYYPVITSEMQIETKNEKTEVMLCGTFRIAIINGNNSEVRHID